MSKGNKSLSVRLDAETLAAVEAEIASATYHAREEVPTVAAWIRSAVKERLAKRRRDRESKARRRKARGEK